ncbi:MAG: hypothetical protein U0002_10990 [Thermoanaerobaculia bacterium]
MSTPSPSGTTLRCPQCGADNALPSGARVVRCAFCEAALFVDRGGLISHYQLPRMVDKSQAVEAMRRWMAGNDTVKDLDTKATITAMEPLRFPVWLFRSSSDQRGEATRIEPAAPTPIPALADLKLPAGRLEPFEPQAEVVESAAVTVPIETARGWLGEDAGSLSETALVHLPLWRGHYQYQGQEYSAYIEGATGAVMASVFPAKAEAPFYLMAILGVLVFLVEGFVVSNPFLKVALYAATALPLALGNFLVARKV